MKSVVCMGEALIDFIPINARKNLKLVEEFVKKPGGAPANVSAAISKLGGKAYFLGSVGDDSFGDFLKDKFICNNINSEFMYKLKNKKTTVAFVSLTEEGERDFEFIRGADEFLNYELIKDELIDFDLYHFGSATAFLGGYLEDSYYKLKRYALDNNKIISFDANYREDLFKNNKPKFIKGCLDFIKDSDIVKLSEEEAYLISEKKDIENAADYIYKLGCKNLIITLGRRGAMLINNEKRIIIPSHEVKMVDSTGAGDAFIGAVIAQILNDKKNIEEVIKLANLVGAITTTRVGGFESIPDWTEVNNYIKDNNL
ncbi:Fructokinase [Clostridium sp. DL-VIII]|uniref:carbohydrate kinase family protein n=1 Tax=Clostridium sp. DL-VIII TaxID=641107 RepID=UPI00023B084C|nr:carbohydrate kinase [Clostridium sp. DL-VIII]EHJ01690.1 Fructokinase [Clostridium sp. DL-VIII]